MRSKKPQLRILRLEELGEPFRQIVEFQKTIQVLTLWVVLSSDPPRYGLSSCADHLRNTTRWDARSLLDLFQLTGDC